MHTPPNPIELTLQLMKNWLGLPEDKYKAQVYLLAHNMPLVDVLEAAVIAYVKFPDGGIRGLKYFCRVCSCRIGEQDNLCLWN